MKAKKRQEEIEHLELLIELGVEAKSANEKAIGESKNKDSFGSLPQFATKVPTRLRKPRHKTHILVNSPVNKLVDTVGDYDGDFGAEGSSTRTK